MTNTLRSAVGAFSIDFTTRGKRLPLLLFVTLLAFCGLASSQSVAPRIFFTDLTSGPNTGGESVNGFTGAYVTIYGNNFGSSQGSSAITLNGSSCLRVVSWGAPWLWYQKVVVQLGSSCSSGKFSMTVNGQSSTSSTITVGGSTIDSAAFAVRSGGIYCVSKSGNDSNSGKFPSSCWATMPKAVHTMKAGDTTYVEDGVTQTDQDSYAPYNAAISVTSAGTAGMPIALVAYPGATVSINTSQNYGIRTPAVNGPGPYWTIAGMNVDVTGNGEGFSFHEANWRTVANTVSCPNSYGTAACLELESDGTSLGHLLYGNTVNNVGIQVNGEKTYHGIYFSASADHSDMGWNLVEHVHGCRGVQFYDSSGRDMGDDHVHDNVMHDIVCDAINFSTMNSDEAGGVEAYNNVMYNVGTGPDPADGSSNYSCVNTNSVNSHTTPVQVYNNTCYNAGFNSADSSASGAFTPNLNTELRNNLVYQTNGQPYISTGSGGCSFITSGSTNNDWYGKGSAPTCSTLAGNKNVNPVVVSTATPDFHLQSGSPLIDAGVTTPAKADITGVVRPQGAAYDIGAYEYNQGTSSAKPSCDLNGDGVVNTADVQIAVNQALGVSACGSADLQQNGSCNVIDVQRVVNASMGAACLTGK